MEEVVFGIAGLGRLGRQHAENIQFRIPGARLTAVCSVVPDELEDAKQNLGVESTYTNYEEFLRNKEMNAVFICSPSQYHCEQIEKALQAGFHVFSEKPLGLYMEEAKKVEKVVHEYPDQLFMLGFMRRYDESYAYAKEKIKEGVIGKPYFIRCYSFDPDSAINGYLKFAKSSYSGGLFLDMCSHDLDLARWFLGSEAQEVWALGGTYKYPEISEIQDAEMGAAMVKFSNESIGMFAAGRSCKHGYHIETEIIGTEGTLRIGTTPDKNQVVVFKEEGAIKESVSGFLERFQQAYLAEVTEFVDCLRYNRKPEVCVEDGVRSTALAYACKESFETGKLVKLVE
jgi:myo-inositol 2-dehydrogenase/D-chiro-inositol 1-dehydrogenase